MNGFFESIAGLCIWIMNLASLPVGVLFLLRRGQLLKFKASDYPKVESERFTEWQNAALNAISITLWTSWGVIGFCTLAVLSAYPLAALIIKLDLPVWVDHTIAMLATVVLPLILMFGWIRGLIVARSRSRKAKALQLVLGIKWP